MPKKKPSQVKTFKKLRIYNAVMGFFHLAQGILMLVLSNNFKLPVTTSYLTFDVITKTVETAKNQIFELQIGPMVAIFLFISAIAHFCLATFGYKWYVKKLKKGTNPARFYEYALSSSVMIVVIAMLCGMYDLSSLILIFALNGTMNLFGLMMELHNQTTRKTNWTTFVFGSIAGVVPWIVIAMYFIGAVESTGDTIPKFVYGILISLFIFFNIFAVNMYLQYKKIGPWKNYLFGEVMFVLLSLIAKTLLAWQVFSGTLRGE
ncbi:heliorhodopsin HeR [Patescibacteria group bacterium]